VAKRTIKALRTDIPANALAAWIAAHHPDLFLALHQQAKAAQTAQKIKLKGLRSLADDAPILDIGVDIPDVSPSIGSSFGFEPGLQSITVDTDSIVPSSFVTDATDTGSSWLSNIGSNPTSSGSSIGSTLANLGSSVLGALGSVGSYLTSPTGLNAATSLAKTIFQTQATVAQAQTQQAVLAAQTGRVATGVQPAPIRYTTDGNGNLIPVYASQTPQGAVYQPLSPQGIASLTPSSFNVFLSQYGIWIAVGVLGLVGFSALLRKG
jgi:hypothetical protein